MGGKPRKKNRFTLAEPSTLSMPVMWGKDARIENPVKVGPFSIINGLVGRDTHIGHNVFIAKDACVGRNCLIQGNVFIPGGVVISDGCFIGPGAVFTNVRRPPLTEDHKGEYEPTTLMRNVSIGANATICPGVTIAEGVLIGAGSVVTKSIEMENTTWAGNPARRLHQ